MEILPILSRYLHVIAATLAIGGTFFMRVLLPLGLAHADANSREAVFLRCRRAFKMTVHPCILVLLVTGAYNSVRAFPDYKLNTPLMHGLWGPHVILGLVAITLSIILLANKTAPPTWHKRGAAINLVILFTVVLLASTVKNVREAAIKNRPAQTVEQPTATPQPPTTTTATTAPTKPR